MELVTNYNKTVVNWSSFNKYIPDVDVEFCFKEHL